MDLLGLDEPSPAACQPQEQRESPQAAATGSDEGDLLGLGGAPFVPPSRAPASRDAAVSSSAAGVASAVEAAASGPTTAQAREVAPPTLEPGVKRFLTRCEGRWRVRSSPSLNSKILGTIASGTIVYAKEVTTEGFEGGSGTTDLVSSTIAAMGLAGAAVGTFVNHHRDKKVEQAHIGSLWVEIIRMEAMESGGVSEIRKDTSSGGLLYCLRRNALGFGLYEDGVEPVDGPLLVLPDAFSMELRADAQRAVDKSEDVSLTWKLLSAAESVKQLFGWADEGGVNEDTFPESKRAEDVFEVKQRDNLKKAAATLAQCAQSLVRKAKAAGFDESEDVTAGLSREAGRRFATLRRDLAAAAASKSENSEWAPAEGSTTDLSRFADACLRVERTGGWPELDADLRQEIVNFSQKHHDHLDICARSLAKNGPVGGRSPSSPASPGSDGGAKTTTQVSATPDLLAMGSSPPRAGRSSQASGSPASGSPGASPFAGLSLLPPPPKAKNAVGSLI